MLHYQTNYSVLEHAIVGICTLYSFELHWGWGGIYIIFHHANVFIVEDNILWH